MVFCSCGFGAVSSFLGLFLLLLGCVMVVCGVACVALGFVLGIWATGASYVQRTYRRRQSYDSWLFMVVYLCTPLLLLSPLLYGMYVYYMQTAAARYTNVVFCCCSR